MTPQETDPDLPRSVQESPAEAGLVVACCRVGGTECSSRCMGPSKGGHHNLHYLHHSLAPGKSQDGVQDLSHSQLLVLFWLTVSSFSIFGCKEYNQSDFGIDHLVMSMYSEFFCVVGRGYLLSPVCSLGKTLLAFALLHSILQGQICLLLQVFLDFLLLHSSPL